MARRSTPDPIPNSAVKTLSADGTASEDAEEQVAAEFDLQLAVLGYQSHLIDQCT